MTRVPGLSYTDNALKKCRTLRRKKEERMNMKNNNSIKPVVAVGIGAALFLSLIHI